MLNALYKKLINTRLPPVDDNTFHKHQQEVYNTLTSINGIAGLPVFANNAAAITGGLSAGMFYRTGADPDNVCVVH